MLKQKCLSWYNSVMCKSDRLMFIATCGSILGLMLLFGCNASETENNVSRIEKTPLTATLNYYTVTAFPNANNSCPSHRLPSPIIKKCSVQNGIEFSDVARLKQIYLLDPNWTSCTWHETSGNIIIDCDASTCRPYVMNCPGNRYAEVTDCQTPPMTNPVECKWDLNNE